MDNKKAAERGFFAPLEQSAQVVYDGRYVIGKARNAIISNGSNPPTPALMGRKSTPAPMAVP